jgi:hypothetical protein
LFHGHDLVDGVVFHQQNGRAVVRIWRWFRKVAGRFGNGRQCAGRDGGLAGREAGGAGLGKFD